MVRTSPDSLEYFAVEPRAITRRYEKRERPVMTSSDNPSASAFSSALAPAYLNGSTATQKPSSARAAPESATAAAREAEIEMEVAAIFWLALTPAAGISIPALRRPSMMCSISSELYHLEYSRRASVADR